MALSKREKYIAFGVAGVVALYALDIVVFEPFVKNGEAIASERAIVEKQLADADQKFTAQRILRRVWNDMTASGGLKTDSSEVQGQAMQDLERWARESGVTWSNLSSGADHSTSVDPKAEKIESKFEKIKVQATGSGSMAAMAKLLWRVESSPKLLKITEIHVTPRKEATDDLQIQLSLATVSLNPDAAQPESAAGTSRPAQAGGEKGQP